MSSVVPRHPTLPRLVGVGSAAPRAVVRLAALLVDPDGRVSSWNGAAEELFGHRSEQVCGRRASGLLPITAAMPSFDATVSPDYRDALDRLDDMPETAGCCVMPVRDRAGSVREALWWAYRTVDPTGRGLLVFATHLKPLRDLGPRLLVGRDDLPYLAATPPEPGSLRLLPRLALPDDPRVVARLAGRLADALPGAGREARAELVRAVAAAGCPAVALAGGPTFPVVPAQARPNAGAPDGTARETAPAGRRGAGATALSPRARLAPLDLPPMPRDAQEADPRAALLREGGLRVGSTLDLDTTAHELVGVTVPRFADFASVHLVDQLIAAAEFPRRAADDRTVLRRVAVTSTRPGTWQELMPEGELHTLSRATPHGLAAQSGQPVLLTRIGRPAEHEAVAVPAELREKVVEHSMLAVPLTARGTVLGVLALIREPRRPPFDAEDAAAAMELAARGALCIDNARLHQAQSRAALTLQRSMLPSRPPRLPGVEIAHRYRPGDRRAEVGGDWFDATQLPGGRVALVVGDVMGHGLHSAAVMGQFRTAVQTMAALDLPPGQLLRHLDNLAQRLGEDHLATCLYAIYDPIRRRLSLASAGHVPPVLVHPDGRGELLDLPAGAPIGVGSVPFEAVHVDAPDGSMLVLCTDGLVEVREGIGAGLRALCENLTGIGTAPELVCDTLLDRMHSERRRDDVALLVARLDGIARDDVATWDLRLEASEVARARRLAAARLADWGLGELTDLATLLVSELVTNALRVASRAVQLRMMRVGKLLVEVSDDDHNLPQLCRAEETDLGGRGLALVSQLAERWGTARKAVGKVVWFELPLPPSPSSPPDGG